ncbi:hypothetical protein U1Q18_005947 [Sarracenia purpurea var. burkii]
MFWKSQRHQRRSRREAAKDLIQAKIKGFPARFANKFFGKSQRKSEKADRFSEAKDKDGKLHTRRGNRRAFSGIFAQKRNCRGAAFFD